jgi:hypothetical protein
VSSRRRRWIILRARFERTFVTNRYFWRFLAVIGLVMAGYAIARRTGGCNRRQADITGLLSAFAWGASTTKFPPGSADGWNIIAAVAAAMALGFAPAD